MGILIVDDDPEMAALLEQMLRAEGFPAAHLAASAAGALGWLTQRVEGEREPVDLVLLDVGLPDVDGLETCRRIRALRTTRRVGIVVVTAYADEDTVERAFAAGANDFLVKPVRPRELRARVRAVVRSLEADVDHAVRERALLGVATELQRTTRELERLSHRDTLTGIGNRRWFEGEFRIEWRRASRLRGLLSTLMIDVDLFHEYNARYGHLEGDRCLQGVAKALSDAMLRPTDRVARYGGEEFVALLPDTDARGARLVGERARAAVEALGVPHAASSCAPVVTISIGVATVAPRPDLAPEVLISAADEALYRAKHEGRNRCVADEPTHADLLARRSDPPLPLPEPLVAHRVPTFGGDRRKVRSIRDALDRGAFGSIRTIGDGLRGVGETFGFAPIRDLVRRIDAGARAGDATAIRGAVTELEGYLDAVRIVRASAGESGPCAGSSAPVEDAGKEAVVEPPRDPVR